MPCSPPEFERWLVAARERYLADLTQREVTRALRALSSCYVERRSKLASGEAMATAGKRAAFALFYGPLHFLTITEIARGVAAPAPTRPARARRVIDLGCGTGAAGAAWAICSGGEVEGFDVNAWAVSEAAWTYARLGVRGSARRVPIDRVRFPATPSDLLAAYVLNEVAQDVRDRMQSALLAAARDGHRVVVVEPLARGATPWWPEWQREFVAAGGRADEWRFQVTLPEFLRTLDKGAGLDHRELTARTLIAG